LMWIQLLNVLSRWVLLGVASYKTYRERNRGWMLIMTAFLLAALDPEKLLLEPLGLNLVSEAAFVLDMINTALQGVLLILAGDYIRPSSSSLRSTFIGLMVGVAAYTWIVLTNVSEYDVSFTVKALAPSLIYAAGYMYMGLLLYRYVVSRRFTQLLFPVGMLLLGALNATYPVTATWEWFVPYGFLLGTLFRIMMAVGALSFVLWPFIISKPEAAHEAPAGAFMRSSWGEVIKTFGDPRRAPNVILITRDDVHTLKEKLHSSALVFWITRVSEGEIMDSPKVYAISPTKIDILTHLIAGAIDRSYSLVVVDAVEYLVVENGFGSTFKFLLNIKDRVLLKGGTMILIVNPDALEEHQVRILEREFKRE